MADNFSTTIANIGNTANSIANGVNTISNLSSALTNVSPDNVLSFIRGSALPNAGEAVGDIISSIAAFSDSNSDDWRVRLSLPTWPSFRASPVLTPLNKAGGLVFPYTPQIQIEQSAKYNPIQTIHSNYIFHAFQNSDPGTISITAPMNVEDSSQAMYWIAALHYLRSMTKMFSGNDPKAGNPPPIVHLNGYGSYVFNNVPVVVTKFTIQLMNDCDYISCDVQTSLAGMVGGIGDAIGSFAGSMGQSISGISGLTAQIANIAGDISQLSDTLGALGLGGSMSGGTAHVPTKSTFTITLQPVYSRNSVRNFSLDRFVNGGYLNNSFGYI